LVISNLHQSANAFADRFTHDRLGSRGILASALRTGGEEIILPSNDLESIRAELDALWETIAHSEIPIAIRLILLRHMSFMSWAIRNIDLVGVPGVYDALAKTMLIATQIPEIADNCDDEAASVKGRLRTVGGRILAGLKIVGAVDRGVEGVGHLGHQGADILQTLLK
jgi:hypothetical protein